MTIVDYNTSRVPLVGTIPITLDTDPTDKQAVFSLELPNLRSGDIVNIAGDGVARVDNTIVMITLCQCAVYMSTDSTFDPDGVSNIEIIAPNGKNIDKFIHYSTQVAAYGWQSDATYNGYYLHFVWWFTSPTATGAEEITVLPLQAQF